ncbi:uncharacterized protein [Penaeus vannamei]|uniref:uncharacterized protein n=1 Tax=Penaeus vannamei TaxID=6689 RepID=UPI00387F62E5
MVLHVDDAKSEFKRKKKSKELKEALGSDSRLKVKVQFHVTLPDPVSGHEGHPVGNDAVACLRKIFDKQVGEKIQQLKAGVSKVPDLQRHLSLSADTVAKDEKLDVNILDQQFFPTEADLKNRLYHAVLSIKKSLVDQENIEKTFENWQKANPEDKIFLRYNKADDNLLFVYQTSFQRHLFNKFGGELALLDATHCTTKYSLPLYILAVKTNVDYQPVAVFATINGSKQFIAEALQIVKDWNSEWKPTFFFTEFCDEINSLKETFPGKLSNGPDHPNNVLNAEDKLQESLESNRKDPASETTMSDNRNSVTVDGLEIKEESDTYFTTDSDIMERVEEREDDLIMCKIKDEVTVKEESIDADVEDNSYTYENCEDPLLTLECKSCGEVFVTISDLETHTRNQHGSGKHQKRGQKRKERKESQPEGLHGRGRASRDEVLDEGIVHVNGKAEMKISPRIGSHSNEDEAVVSENGGGSPTITSFRLVQGNSSHNQQRYTDKSTDADPHGAQASKTSSSTEGMTADQEGISSSLAQLVQNQTLVATLLSELVAGQKQLVASQKDMLAVARDGVNAIQEALELFKK